MKVIKTSAASDNSLNTGINSFSHKIVYQINLWLLNLDSKFVLLNYLFGAVTLTKNDDPDKYFYSGYGIDLMLVELPDKR